MENTEKGRRNMRGYLTVYLALTITVILSLYLALIEGARCNAIRLEAECVTDIAMNSVLAEYHQELYRQYNLFAIDTSYGTMQSGKKNVEEHLREYVERNLSQEDIFLEYFLYRDFLAMSLKGLELTHVSNMADDNGAGFRRRAIEAIKDDVGLSLMEDLVKWADTVTSYEMLERNISAEKSAVDDEIDTYDGMERQISEKEWIRIDIENPTDVLEKIRRKGNLQIVVDNPDMISDKGIVSQNLFASRMENGEVSSGNWKWEEKTQMEQLTERFFFQEYLMKYMGYYGKEDVENALQYQLEYLINAKESDYENLNSTVNTLCAMREVANAVYLFSDQEKCKLAEGIAQILAALMMVPEIAELLMVTIILGWAYAESLYDVKVLLKGGKVPLLKDDRTWHYDAETALQGTFAVSKEHSEGLSYEDYLRILMSFVELDALTARAMDMVEADIRKMPGNTYFRMDACYDCIELDIMIQSAYGYEYEITRQKTY